MKKIEAIIKPFKLDEVKEALQEAGIRGHAPSSKRRASAGKRAHRTLSGREYVVDFLPKVKIEVVVSDENLRAAIEAIRNAAQPVGSGMARYLYRRSRKPFASAPGRPAPTRSNGIQADEGAQPS